MIRQERDAELINRITNDPAVLPYIARHGKEIDWSPALGPIGGCLVLSNGEDAVMILERTAERDWQLNTIFAPTCRGKRAVETGREMRDWMIPKFADRVFGSIPNGFRHAIWFYRQLGGKQIEKVESGGETYHAQPNETLYVFEGAE